MSALDVAHINEQGSNLVIVIVDQSITREQAEALQDRVTNARLVGIAVPVWPEASGTFGFCAPIRWQTYFQNLTWDFILANVNRKLPEA